MFPLDEIELSSQILDGDIEDCAQIFRDGHTGTGRWGFDKFRNIGTTAARKTLKRWTQAYLACVAYADACIGMALDALWDGPHADNTYVVLTSDNGYHMGEKDYLFKNSLWERSARVPLLIAGPDCAQGVECDQPVTLVDIFPTINEWLDLPTDTGALPLDGHSFASLARDPEASWDGPACAITAIANDTPVDAATPADRHDQHYCVRSRTHRYLRYANGEEELYDHQDDPYEWHNRAADPALADIKAELRAQLQTQAGV